MIPQPMMDSHIKFASHFMGPPGLSVAPKWRTVILGGGRAHPSAFFPQPLPESLGLSSLSQWTHSFCGILPLKCARIQIQAGSLSRELHAVSTGLCAPRIQIPVHPADRLTLLQRNGCCTELSKMGLEVSIMTVPVRRQLQGDSLHFLLISLGMLFHKLSWNEARSFLMCICLSGSLHTLLTLGGHPGMWESFTHSVTCRSCVSEQRLFDAFFPTRSGPLTPCPTEIPH